MPRIARLMALAIRLEELVRSGLVRDDAELARLGQVSPARISQIVGLNLLAPDIQEEILFMPPTLRGRDPLREAHVRPRHDQSQVAGLGQGLLALRGSAHTDRGRRFRINRTGPRSSHEPVT